MGQPWFGAKWTGFGYCIGYPKRWEGWTCWAVSFALFFAVVFGARHLSMPPWATQPLVGIISIPMAIAWITGPR